MARTVESYVWNRRRLARAVRVNRRRPRAHDLFNRELVPSRVPTFLNQNVSHSQKPFHSQWLKFDTQVTQRVLDREWRSRTASRWRGERGAGPCKTD